MTLPFEQPPQEESGCRRLRDLSPSLKLMLNRLPIPIGKEGIATKDFLIIKHQTKGPARALKRLGLPLEIGPTVAGNVPNIDDHPGIIERQQRLAKFSQYHRIVILSGLQLAGSGMGDVGSAIATITVFQGATTGEQRGQPEHGTRPPWGWSKFHEATLSAGNGPTLIDKVFQTYRKTISVKEHYHAVAI